MYCCGLSCVTNPRVTEVLSKETYRRYQAREGCYATIFRTGRGYEENKRLRRSLKEKLSMILGLHGLFYSSDADSTRAFIRDKLKLPFSDVGDGWLIFDLPEADLGVHPIGSEGQPPAGTHNLSFYCDDIEGTVADLKSRGVSFKKEIEDHGYGFVTYFTMPGEIDVQLYEPKYRKKESSSKIHRKAKGQARSRKGSGRKPKRSSN
jgi:hypothetical protein